MRGNLLPYLAVTVYAQSVLLEEAGAMIRCNLSRLMGERKIKISEVARQTGLNRSTVTALYYDKAKRVEFETIELLCDLFQCEIEDLFVIDIEEKKKQICN